MRPIFQILLGRKPVHMLTDPFADVIGIPFVELLEIFRDDKPVVRDVMTGVDASK